MNKSRVFFFFFYLFFLSFFFYNFFYRFFFFFSNNYQESQRVWMEAIIITYLLDTKSPNFNDFVGKNERKIINLSTRTSSTNAFKLMTLWINKYNKTVRNTRPTANLQKKWVDSTECKTHFTDLASKFTGSRRLRLPLKESTPSFVPK